jgi:hypothetical protein
VWLLQFALAADLDTGGCSADEDLDMNTCPTLALSAVRLAMSLAAETAAGAAPALPQLVGGLPYRHMWTMWVHEVRPARAAGTHRRHRHRV